MASHVGIQKSLGEYLKEVEEGSIRIPQFQRNFVWSKSQMIKLAASLLKGYPISSFLLMENTAGEYATRAVEGSQTEIDNTQKSFIVLDGQQRTTTSYQVFCDKGEYSFYFNYKKFTIDISNTPIENADAIIEDNIEDWIVVFEKKSKKRPATEADQIAQGLFPFTSILNGGYTEWLSRYNWNHAQGNHAEHTKLTSITAIFTNIFINNIIKYQVAQIIINGDTTPNIVCTIFETINSTGVKLTIIDLLNAKCFPKDFHLNDEIGKLLEDERYTIFQQFDTDIIGLALVKLIGLIERKSCKKADLLRLSADNIKNRWAEAVNALNQSLIFIKSNFGVIGKRYIPYVDMIPCIARITSDAKFDITNTNHIKKITKWYWNCVFQEHFDNATETKSALSVSDFLGDASRVGWLENDSNEPAIVKNSELQNSDFKDLFEVYSTGGAKYKAIFNLILLNEAPDFIKNSTTINNLAEKNLEDHHIFPKKFLARYEIKGPAANSILNRTLISCDANGKIKDEQPCVYFQNADLFGGNLLKEEDLDKHFINIKFTNSMFAYGIFSENNFDKFKEERQKSIVKLIKEKIK